MSAVQRDVMRHTPIKVKADPEEVRAAVARLVHYGNAMAEATGDEAMIAMWSRLVDRAREVVL